MPITTTRSIRALSQKEITMIKFTFKDVKNHEGWAVAKLKFNYLDELFEYTKPNDIFKITTNGIVFNRGRIPPMEIIEILDMTMGKGKINRQMCYLWYETQTTEDNKFHLKTIQTVLFPKNRKKSK